MIYLDQKKLDSIFDDRVYLPRSLKMSKQKNPIGIFAVVLFKDLDLDNSLRSNTHKDARRLAIEQELRRDMLAGQ